MTKNWKNKKENQWYDDIIILSFFIRNMKLFVQNEWIIKKNVREITHCLQKGGKCNEYHQSKLVVNGAVESRK